MNKFVILIPSFNDWDCLELLIPVIDSAVKNIKHVISILVVNDGSTEKHNLFFKKISKIKKIQILNLKKNVKAQIAISTGLDYLRKEKFDGGIIVMDADGQDDPQKLPIIIQESEKNPTQTITINRSKREDELLFKIFYQIYLFLTFILTFKYLKFGVFSYIHSSSIDKVLSTEAVYMAYVAGLAKHCKNKKIIYAERKKRIMGKSQNNYLSLIHYALKIISVFRLQALANTLVFLLATISAVYLNFFSNIFLFLSLLLLIINFIFFLLPYRINKSVILNPLLNVKDVENLKI